jgi:hypothetical protein
VEGQRRVRHIDDSVDLVKVEPGAGDTGSDIGLVQMAVADDLDFSCLSRGAEILYPSFAAATEPEPVMSA